MEFVPKLDKIERISIIQKEENKEGRESVETLMANMLAGKQFTQSPKYSTETFIQCLENVKTILSEKSKLDEKVYREYMHISKSFQRLIHMS